MILFILLIRADHALPWQCCCPTKPANYLALWCNSLWGLYTEVVRELSTRGAQPESTA